MNNISDAKYRAIRAIRRELGADVQARFIPTKSGFWWCELTLPRFGYERATVCCPGATQEDAASSAVKQASRLRKMVA